MLAGACMRARAGVPRSPAPSALFAHPAERRRREDRGVQDDRRGVHRGVEVEALRGGACEAGRCTGSFFWQVDGEARVGERRRRVGEARALHAAAAGAQNGAASQRGARAAARLWRATAAWEAQAVRWVLWTFLVSAFADFLFVQRYAKSAESTVKAVSLAVQLSRRPRSMDRGLLEAERQRPGSEGSLNAIASGSGGSREGPSPPAH